MQEVEVFKTAFRNNIKRDGAEHLLNWLETKTDFFTAPCSTKHHLARPGGLVEHSVNVFGCLQGVLECKQWIEIDPESVAIVALCHDICKVNFYGTEMRNRKIDGTWQQVEEYVVKDQFPYGHGEKSVLYLQRFIDLKPEEVMAIRWHMGAWTDGVKSDYAMTCAYGEAMKFHPLVPLLHMADMEATYLVEREE